MPRKNQKLPEIVMRLDARAHESEERIGRAMASAAAQLIETYDNQTQAMLATGIRQQTIGAMSQKRELGLGNLLRLVLVHGDEGIDGFVRRFSEAKLLPFPRTMQISAGELEGWSEAVAQAREEHPASGISEFAWRAASAVVLPARPRTAPVRPELAFDLAALIERHCEGSTHARRIQRHSHKK